MTGVVVLLLIWAMLVIGQAKQYPAVMKRIWRDR